jgi:hypothetical protein
MAFYFKALLDTGAGRYNKTLYLRNYSRSAFIPG